MRAAAGEVPLECHVLLTRQAQERWFVARTQPHRETLAERQLANQNFRVFLPRLLKSRRHARKFETISAPLFPGYLFIILDLTRDHWRRVNGTYGVDRLLTQGGRPEPVPHGLVEQLLAAANADGVVRRNADLRPGQSIRISAGPFAELVGQLQGLDDSGRVRILLEVLGGQVPVLLPESFVVPADRVA